MHLISFVVRLISFVVTLTRRQKKRITTVKRNESALSVPYYNSALLDFSDYSHITGNVKKCFFRFFRVDFISQTRVAERHSKFRQKSGSLRKVVSNIWQIMCSSLMATIELNIKIKTPTHFKKLMRNFQKLHFPLGHP